MGNYRVPSHLKARTEPPSRPVLGLRRPVAGPVLTTGLALVQPGIAQYRAPSAAWTMVEFGDAIAKPGKQAGSWSLDMISPTAQRMAGCKLAARELRCG